MIPFLYILGLILLHGQFSMCSKKDTPDFSLFRSSLAKKLNISNMHVHLEYDQELEEKIKSITEPDCLKIMHGSDYRYFFPMENVVYHMISEQFYSKIFGEAVYEPDYSKRTLKAFLENISAYSGPTMNAIEYAHPKQSKIACSTSFRCKGHITPEVVKEFPKLAQWEGQPFNNPAICLLGPHGSFKGTDFEFNGANTSGAVLLVSLISFLATVF